MTFRLYSVEFFFVLICRFMEQSYQDIMNEAQKRRDDALEENKMLEKKVTVRIQTSLMPVL